MPHMYILECVDGSYYTGSTIDLDRRLWQHQNGLGANHTAKRLPVKLVYCEFFDRVSDAFYREKQVQGWTRKKKKALMVSDSNMLHQLAECQNETHFRRLVRDDFGFAQSPPAQSPDVTGSRSSSLSEVEGNGNEAEGNGNEAEGNGNEAEGNGNEAI